VRELVTAKRPSLICLQETKFNVLNIYDVPQLLGHGFDYAYPPSAQTCGGIMIAWSHSCWSVFNIAMGSYSITAKVRRANGAPDWRFTMVYNPMIDSDKPAFLSEL
jgi:hypothetical protein